MTTLSFPLDPATESALDELSAKTKRPKSEIAAEALADYLREAAALEALAAEAREDFSAGRTFTHEETMASARAIIEAAQAQRG